MRAAAVNLELHERIDPLEDEWDGLAGRASAHPFLRPGWFRAWWRAFGEGTPLIVALRRDGRLAAVMPLSRSGGRLESPTNWHTPEFGPLAEDGDAARHLAEALFTYTGRSIRLSFLDGDDPGVRECLTAADRVGYRVLTRVLERSPYVPTDGDWSSYESSRPKHLLTELRRRRRRLEEQGKLSVVSEDGRERLEELLEDGFRVEASGWKAERGTAILSDPRVREFYTEVARWAAAKGWLRLTFLRLDDRPLAFQYIVEDGDRIYHLKGGYDPDYAKFAPGTLLIHEILARAFADGVRSYEFLGDEDAFKLEWTSQVRERLLLQAFASSPAGLVEWAAFAYGRPLAKRVLALRRR